MESKDEESSNADEILGNTSAKDDKTDLTEHADDPELDDLLDSALKDFEKASQAVSSQGSKSKPSTGHRDKPPDGAAAAAALSEEAMMNEVFASEFAEQASKQFDDAMKNLLGDDPELVEQMHKLAYAAEKAGDGQEKQQEFEQTLAETLGSLAQNTQELQDHFPEEDLLGALSHMSMQDIEEGNLDFLPMMQGMMQSLLSKEVLYPSLKEISDKYPQWLEEHKDTLEKSQYDQYERQNELMTRICGHFEEEKKEDSPEVKRQRFEKIIELMQKMQECGQPPSDLVGEMPPGLEFDAQGNPKMPGAQDGCTVM
ncbi:peroxisomal biogenesis factor 19 isoform X2 [Lingula anatina]|uniref:Peroxin-19 n=1 Tax=Lingula anatina TaxID=7574 RepID=A0A1S3ISW8_LINAN|nr:peroxisomal biogenesis factor 19 isoform X1 [Lingula anatina]XP_013400624.1 peroxisomal biogenesis factor 19 isoform X2 [Lingula anatina]|eukprot:XP_013400623.1 peroxisomal biogenesis factor 19 isoform X1 [Lingula anatina]